MVVVGTIKRDTRRPVLSLVHLLTLYHVPHYSQSKLPKTSSFGEIVPKIFSSCKFFEPMCHL